MRATAQGAWIWIKRQPGPVRASELALALRTTRLSASMMLQRLKALGAMQLHGTTHSACWTIRDRTVLVESQAGLHPKSIDNLRWRWGRVNGKGHATVKRNPDWIPATELEQCWKLITPSMDKSQGTVTLDTSGSFGTPVGN